MHVNGTRAARATSGYRSTRAVYVCRLLALCHSSPGPQYFKVVMIKFERQLSTTRSTQVEKVYFFLLINNFN